MRKWSLSVVMVLSELQVTKTLQRYWRHYMGGGGGVTISGVTLLYDTNNKKNNIMFYKNENV